MSKLITGKIGVGYQPDVIDHEVDVQGLNSDFDDRPYEPPMKVKRGRKKKRSPASPGEKEEIVREDPEEEEADEAVDEDDADDLEVDVVDGASRMVRRGTLKAEAKTIQHLRPHRYKKPYFESCICGKMRHFQDPQRSIQKDTQSFRRSSHVRLH